MLCILKAVHMCLLHLCKSHHYGRHIAVVKGAMIRVVLTLRPNAVHHVTYLAPVMLASILTTIVTVASVTIVATVSVVATVIYGT